MKQIIIYSLIDNYAYAFESVSDGDRLIIGVTDESNVDYLAMWCAQIPFKVF